MPEHSAGPTARRPVGPVLVVVAAVCWGTGGLAGSVLGDTSGLSPVAVGAYRLLVGAVVLLAFQLLPGRSGRLRDACRLLLADRGDAWRVVGVGVGLAQFQVCYFLAVSAVGVSVATLLALGLAPVLVTLGGALLLREPVGRRLRLVLPVALLGLVLRVGVGVGVGVGGGVGGGGGGGGGAGGGGAGGGGGVAGDGRMLLGAGYACASALGYAAVTLLGRSLAARVAGEHVTSLGFVVAGVLVLPVGLVAGMAAPLTGTTVGLVLYLGVVPTALAYGLFFAGLRHTASGTASVLTLAEPLTATVLAVALLDERLGSWQWVGAALLATAVLVLSVRPAGPGLPSEDGAGGRGRTDGPRSDAGPR